MASDPFPFDEAAEQPGPDFVDDADALEPGSRRQSGQDAVPAFHHEHVRRIHRTEDHPHAHLAGPGMGVWYVPDLQHLRRVTEFLEDCGFHFFPNSPGGSPRPRSVQHLENRRSSR